MSAPVSALQRRSESFASANDPGEPGTAPDHWSSLVGAQTSQALCTAWLAILCEWLPGTRAAVVLLHDGGERYAPAAVWPDPTGDLSHFADIAQQALAERRGVMRDAAGGLMDCAYPLDGTGETLGVVVLQMSMPGEAALRQALRVLHWGAGWLASLPDKRELADRGRRLQRSALLQDVLLGVLCEPRVDDAARWVVNRIADAMPCRMAMLARTGAGSARTLRLVTVSGTAGFEPSANVLALAREAMAEALAPGRPGCGTAAGSALGDYCHEAGSRAALALQLIHQGRRVGALLLDIDRTVDAELEQFAHALAAALAPCLDVQHAARRGLWAHARDGAADSLRWVVGPRRPGLKLITIALLLALGLAATVEVDDHVRAPATVEGLQQRAAVAPFDGYIVEAPVRPGDTVHVGDVLARLDDRDLKLEEARTRASAEVAERKLREALAHGEAVAVRVAEAELDEARAALALARERLARAVVTSPLDGQVVRGDLSQQIGAPVEQGKVLFELAPALGWRVVLKVDERDTVKVQEGQAGEVLLAGLPGERFAVRVSKVSPVAQAEDGRNAFRVEAQVTQDAARIQPGMEGVGRVLVGHRALLWVGLHRVVDGVRYWAWTLGL